MNIPKPIIDASLKHELEPCIL